MVAAELATSISKALGLSVFKGVYDFQLDQFGIRKDDGETFSHRAERLLFLLRRKPDRVERGRRQLLPLTGYVGTVSPGLGEDGQIL